LKSPPKARPLADGRLLLACHAAGRFGIDHHRGAQLLEGDELLLHALLLLLDGTVEQAAGEQPETSFNWCALRMGPSFPGPWGTLPPVSVPLKPAARLSLRQVSSDVSPPSCGRSSLDQATARYPDGRPWSTLRCAASSCLRRDRPAALRTLSRELTWGTADIHQASPGVHCEALTLISMT